MISWTEYNKSLSMKLYFISFSYFWTSRCLTKSICTSGFHFWAQIVQTVSILAWLVTNWAQSFSKYWCLSLMEWPEYPGCRNVPEEHFKCTEFEIFISSFIAKDPELFDTNPLNWELLLRWTIITWSKIDVICRRTKLTFHPLTSIFILLSVLF